MGKSLIPGSTYRLQFSHLFTFRDATRLTRYFASLGISHLYVSPLLKSKKGSTHGYDVVDHHQLNPELGTEGDFTQFIEQLKEYQLGLILDIVPNHMAIGMENPWWMDLLENGHRSKFASFFDINWTPVNTAFKDKVFIPILEKPFGNTLEEGRFIILYREGKFILQYEDFLLPTSLESWQTLLLPLYDVVLKLFSDHEKTKELFSIIGQLQNYSQLKSGEREGYKPDIEQALSVYFRKYDDVYPILMQQLEILNGVKGNTISFDRLEKFLGEQHYRLCYWKVANDEINYRRFFDICEYASIRVEDSQVFAASHQKVFELLNDLSGLRIDHIDGLRDPLGYLEKLKNATKIPYLIVEKILTGNEKVQDQWPVQGTVGYDFLNQVNGVFVFQANKQKFLDIYKRFTGIAESTKDIKYESKALLLSTSLASELNFLNIQLNHIASQIRCSRDFTSDNLKKALAAIIAYFPVYRSYIRAMSDATPEIHEEDRKYIHASIERAKRHHSLVDPSIYDFILSILLLQYTEGMSPTLRSECNDFVMHFQQVTGPVMAKGLEDTACYRYYPLSSLNEVGGDLNAFGISIDNFHKKNIERFSDHPHSMLTTTTHDTKRSEDVRARINVLSEIPERWEKAITQWSALNQQYKTLIDDCAVPDANEEYLIYQTLAGTWPLHDFTEESLETYTPRIQEFLEKAIKEAKVHSSWIDTNEPYHLAVKQFIGKILTVHSSNTFIEHFKGFMPVIEVSGMLNSLSQLILKLTSPGVPDIYQGNEIWDFSLVDPDNRRGVDYALRQRYMAMNFTIQECMEHPADGRVKLFITKHTLGLRKLNPEVFAEGAYIELMTEGVWKDHVIAFARYLPGKTVIVLTCRFFTFLLDDFQNYTLKSDRWGDMFLTVPVLLTQKKYKDIYTQKIFTFTEEKIPLEGFFNTIPFAVLESE